MSTKYFVKFSEDYQVKDGAGTQYKVDQEVGFDTLASHDHFVKRGLAVSLGEREVEDEVDLGLDEEDSKSKAPASKKTTAKK